MDIPEKVWPKEKIGLWKNVYEGQPPWAYVRRSGLYGRGERRMNMLNCAKVLCDSLSSLTFSNQADIILSDEKMTERVLQVFDENGFWENFPQFLSRAYALGGGALRVYINSGKVCIDYVSADAFVPLGTDRGRVTRGEFYSSFADGKREYLLTEHHSMEMRGGGSVAVIERELRERKGTGYIPADIGLCGLSERDEIVSNSPMFAYFRPILPDPCGESLCGISVLENCMDTIKALDTVFDSFVREFILGRKRIIVPSSCIRTVVDPDTGKIRRYFDTDDEVYQALKCDEEDDLKIIDNTTQLRVEEHTKSINTLLDILCFQTGLSAGTLSFSSGGIKTAQEIRSMETRTQITMQQNRAMAAELIEQCVGAVLTCLALMGENADPSAGVRISFIDTQTHDQSEIISQNISLYKAGLRSGVSAIMSILDCSRSEAAEEMERIERERERSIK